ncbi:MAG: 2-C-methyl-D-erythritol 2,4-cyclodiphosphate synthase [Clostridia bacterium]
MKCAIGQDSHKFCDDPKKKLLLGGVEIPGHRPLEGNSDADVVLHALTNAVSGITGVIILGEHADRMCKDMKITDSSCYLKEGLRHLGFHSISHVSFSMECATPVLAPHIPNIRESVACLLGIDVSCVGITATSGEGLTSFGRGEGILCTCIITVA